MVVKRWNYKVLNLNELIITFDLGSGAGAAAAKAGAE